MATRHEAVIPSLRPGARYSYRVYSAHGLLAGASGTVDFSFRAPEADVLRFVAHQDSGYSSAPHLAVAPAGGRVSCERCHTTDGLKASRFDHSRDAAYTLDGAHARLACGACHRPETRGGVTFVRYEPLPTTCRGCHGGQPAKGDRP